MNTRPRFLIASFSVLLLCMFASSSLAPRIFAQARVDKYIVTTPTLTWVDLSTNGGTMAYNGIWHYYNGSLAITLPFAFNYDNTAIAANSTIYMTEASLDFGNTLPYYIFEGGLGNSSYPGLLVPFGGPMIGIGGRFWSDNGIYTQLTGTVGSRVFTVQMNHVHGPCAPLEGGPSAGCSIQVKLFESTNVIQFLYQSHGTTVSACGSYYAGSIGLNGFDSPSFSSLTYANNLETTPYTDIQFSPVQPPQITQQPVGTTLCTGQSLSLSVTATGDGLTYQWQRNGTNIPGATSATYTVASVSSADSGNYDVVVSGSEPPSVTSNTVLVTVEPPPTISLTLSPNELWPPNNKLNTITATVTTTGDCTPLSVQLVSITANESLQPGDVQNASLGTDDPSFDLRATRDGSGTGRMYTATYSVTDAAGNTATASATVTVPHDQGAFKEAGEGQNTSLLPIEVTVHPNPAFGYARICVPELPEGSPATLIIANSAGEIVATLYDATPVSDLGLCYTLDCSKLASGIYFARLWNDVQGSSVKFIKQ
jgi:hypothetical protein